MRKVADVTKPHIIQIRVKPNDYKLAKELFARDGLTFAAGIRQLLARYVRGELK